MSERARLQGHTIKLWVNSGQQQLRFTGKCLDVADGFVILQDERTNRTMHFSLGTITQVEVLDE